MSDFLKATIGILIPFIGTTLGSAFVFFLKKDMNPKMQKALLGFASGVMIAGIYLVTFIPGN